MNVIFLTSIIFTLVLVHGEQGGNSKTSNLAHNRSNPCQAKSKMRAYDNFMKRHILQRDFDLNSMKAWRRYLRKFKLCGRARVQSFINKADEENVLQICSDAGRRLRDNLCISRSTMVVYHVKSIKKKCRIRNVNRSKHHVIVACNKIGNQCLPVHYERYNKQKPGNIACT